MSTVTMAASKFETSLLDKFINGSKYSSYHDAGRRKQNLVAFEQEPVGYLFFTSSNINKILGALELVHGHVEFDDVSTIMLDIFYTKASNYAHYLPPNDIEPIYARLAQVNVWAIEAINKQLGNNMHLQAQYEFVLDHPNRLAPLPVSERIWNAESINTRYSNVPTGSLAPAQKTISQESRAARITRASILPVRF
jgi:hypothetical protein